MILSINLHGCTPIQQPLKSSNGRLVGAIESALRFDGTNKIEAKIIVSIDLIAPTCLQSL